MLQFPPTDAHRSDSPILDVVSMMPNDLSFHSSASPNSVNADPDTTTTNEENEDEKPRKRDSPCPKSTNVPEADNPCTLGYITKDGITVELCGQDLWKKFYKLGTEMIITKAGR